jgi:sulfotransferase family protein
MMSLKINFLKHISTEFTWPLRRLTASQRALPNCFIVGAQKAGTSSLYHYLIQHPQVHKSFKKEIHYFNGGTEESQNKYAYGENWYRAHFPKQKQLKHKDICVDATPIYLFDPTVAQRIHKLTPTAKIIILLRDPVERAISHYFHVKRWGFEKLPIEQALAQEAARLTECYSQKDFKKPSFRLYSYQARGLYLEQIKYYEKYFAQEKILIINSTDLFRDPKLTLKQVFSFLNITDDCQIDDLKSQNVGSNKEKVSLEVYQHLQAYFSQPNLELFAHLQQHYQWLGSRF